MRAIAFAVEVALADDVGREARRARDAVERFFDDHHSLRPTETSERGLRRLVGLADSTGDPKARDPVAVVDVEEGARQDGLAQVEAVATVAVELRVEGVDAPIVGVRDLEAPEEGVTLPGEGHVALSVEADAHGAPGLLGADRRDGGPGVRLDLLAPERAAHPQRLAGDRVAGDAEHARDDDLRLGGMLRRGVDQHLAALVDVGQRRLSFEIEVLLPADLHFPREATGRLGDGRRDARVSVEGLDDQLVIRERLLVDRVLDGEDRVLRFGVDHHSGGGAAGEQLRLGEHPGDGLAVVLDLAWEERLVLPSGSDIGYAGDVGFTQHGDHAGHLGGGRGVDVLHERVCVWHRDGPGVE